MKCGKKNLTEPCNHEIVNPQSHFFMALAIDVSIGKTK